MAIALTREVSAALVQCELTHQCRVPIDLELARRQHAAYEQALRDAGYLVERLPTTAEMADSVFIEDVAVVVDELAIVTRPGAASRRAEIPVVADALARYRTVRAIEPPGTIDGGDVLTVGRRMFIGRSTRTNGAGIEQMRRLLAPHGYVVCEVEVRGCLHLKSAVTALADGLLLINPAWLDRRAFPDFEFVDVDPGEAMAANALRLRDRIIYQTAFPRTADRLASRGLRLALVDASECAKAEGAVTCCSVLINSESSSRQSTV